MQCETDGDLREASVSMFPDSYATTWMGSVNVWSISKDPKAARRLSRVEVVLQDMYKILATRICWGCHMVAIEGDVRKHAPGRWSG